MRLRVRVRVRVMRVRVRVRVRVGSTPNPRRVAPVRPHRCRRVGGELDDLSLREGRHRRDVLAHARLLEQGVRHLVRGRVRVRVRVRVP